MPSWGRRRPTPASRQHADARQLLAHSSIAGRCASTAAQAIQRLRLDRDWNCSGRCLRDSTLAVQSQPPTLWQLYAHQMRTTLQLQLLPVSVLPVQCPTLDQTCACRQSAAEAAIGVLQPKAHSSTGDVQCSEATLARQGTRTMLSTPSAQRTQHCAPNVTPSLAGAATIPMQMFIIT